MVVKPNGLKTVWIKLFFSSISQWNTNVMDSDLSVFIRRIRLIRVLFFLVRLNPAAK
jgi:hypothetical protein